MKGADLIYITFAFVALATVLSYAVEQYRAKNDTSHIIPVIIPVLYFCLSLYRNGVCMAALKDYLWALLLVYASMKDLEKREVEDAISVMLLLVALIDNTLPGMLSALPGMLIIFIPQLIVAAINPGKYGGADIKISTSAVAACSFAAGVTGVCTGLAIGVIIQLVMRKKGKTGYPLVPYMAAGLLVATAVIV